MWKPNYVDYLESENSSWHADYLQCWFVLITVYKHRPKTIVEVSKLIIVTI